MILLMLVVGAGAWWLFAVSRPAEGVVPMGGESERVALVSLITAIITNLTALIGLIREFRNKPANKD
jgi:hypothetical protein